MRNLDDPEWLAKERSLVDRAKAGSHKAFVAIYSEFSAALFAVFFLIVHNLAQANDVRSHTFLTGWKDLAKFSSQRSIYFWLRAIGVNKAKRLKRNDKRDAPLPEEEDDVDALLGPMNMDIESGLDLPRMKRRVHERLNQLGEGNHQRVLRLFYLEELSHEECAAALGMTMGAFYTALSRAHAAFRKLWDVPDAA